MNVKEKIALEKYTYLSKSEDTQAPENVCSVTRRMPAKPQ